MPTNKQKRKLRARQRIADRQPTKEQQIHHLMRRIDSVPRNAFTGQPEFGKVENDSN